MLLLRACSCSLVVIVIIDFVVAGCVYCVLPLLMSVHSLRVCSAHSKKVTDARYTVMEKRDETMKAIKAEALMKLRNVSEHEQYPMLVKQLMIEGLIRILEEKITVQCREVDLKLVQGAVDGAVKSFQDLVNEKTGVVPVCSLVVDTKTFLPPPPADGKTGASCVGGVKLIAFGGKIVCDNTMEK